MLKFKHKYAEQKSLATQSGADTQYQFSVNGMYDPNITGTGGQPMFFDQIAGIYDHYTVIGSKIKWTVINASTTAVEPYRCVFWINDDTTTSVGFDSLVATTGAQTRFAQGGLNPDRIIVEQYWSARKNFGNCLANDELKGTAAANPAEQQYFQITLRAVDSVTVIPLWVLVEIEYTAIWRERKEISLS